VNGVVSSSEKDRIFEKEMLILSGALCRNRPFDVKLHQLTHLFPSLSNGDGGDNFGSSGCVARQ
jgi:hypothetical protein